MQCWHVGRFGEVRHATSSAQNGGGLFGCWLPFKVKPKQQTVAGRNLRAEWASGSVVVRSAERCGWGRGGGQVLLSLCSVLLLIFGGAPGSEGARDENTLAHSLGRHARRAGWRSCLGQGLMSAQ